MATVMNRRAALILTVIATEVRGPRGSRDREREAGIPPYRARFVAAGACLALSADALIRLVA